MPDLFERGAVWRQLIHIGPEGGPFVPVSSANPVPVNGNVSAGGGVLVDRSGSIAAGGVAQLLAAVNAGRKYLLVQNQSAGDLWIDFGTAAVAGAPSIQLPAGAAFVMEGTFVATQDVHIVGASAGAAFAAKES